WAVARGAYKLMAYKDEYEVARLYTDGRFRESLARELQGARTLEIHLAPPLISAFDKRAGPPRKLRFGQWIMLLFRVLYRMRRLREGPLDILGRSAERRLERQLRDEYEATIRRLGKTLSAERLQEAVDLAPAPAAVRGFGHVKEKSAQALLTRLR